MNSSANLSPERALLLGLLAWKLNFVGFDALINSLRAWEMNPSQEFGPILRVHGQGHRLYVPLFIDLDRTRFRR